LRQLIACYWQISGHLTSTPALQHRVLPDACIDLLLDLKMWRLTASGAAASLVGAMTQAMQFELCNRVDLLGVRFRPGGAAAMLRAALDAITDRTAALAAFSEPLCGGLLDELATRTTLHERARCLDHEFLRRIPAQGRVQRRIERAVRLLDGTSDGASVCATAREIGFSTRQFERRFVEAIGLTPAQFRRVRRLRRLLALQAQAPPRSLAALAAQCGYFDQSHLNREFRALVGCTPSRWLTSSAAVAFVQEGRLAVF
jgi:AraC-like DNA-binding protein